MKKIVFGILLISSIAGANQGDMPHYSPQRTPVLSGSRAAKMAFGILAAYACYQHCKNKLGFN